MKQKIAGLFIIISLIFPQASFVFAQTLNTTTTNTTTNTEPVSEPAPEPEPTVEATPVEETITPPADTDGPTFISVATASAEETEVTVVWTTNEPAYGFVEYGETTSYGLTTSKSSETAMDHTVSVTGLAPNTNYHYRIIAEGKSGNVSYSKDRTFETAVEAVAIDNVPPEISEVSVTNVAISTASINWITNELAQGKVEYGKTSEYGLSSPLTDDYATEHATTLSGLDPDAEYHYRVVVQDESANESVSPDEIFITDPIPETASVEETTSTEPKPEPQKTATTTSETTKETTTSTTSTATTTATTTNSTATSTTTATTTIFAISHVETTTISTSTATIIWKTNEPATSQVFYGTSENYASSSITLTGLVLSHEIKLTGLKSGTNYFYKVISKNVSGKIIEKSEFTFNTLFKQKTVAVAPTISGVTVESVGTSTATIIFTTDKGATGKINYGTTTGYEETDGGHKTLLTNHSYPLSGLSPDTLYNFETVVQDVSGNETIYKNVTFKTFPRATAEKLESVIVTPVPTPTPSRSSSGDGGGGYYYAPQRVIGKPVVTKVDPLDKQVLFVWQKAKPESGIKTIIIKSASIYVSSPNKGTEVYRGNSGRFVDTDLQNGTKYYYSIFRANETGTYSAPLHFTVVPKQNETQTRIIATPSVVQKTPIYKFSKELSLEDQNKQVEHLQVLLASESSLYQRGLITGYFGPLTERAVKAFQKRYKLPVTGIANSVTLKKLEQFSSIEVAKDRAETHDKALMRDLVVGLKGGDVAVLQQFLIDAEVYPEALVTSYFGLLTRTAVQRFQREQNISPAVGYFGPITKKRMLNLIRLRSVSF